MRNFGLLVAIGFVLDLELAKRREDTARRVFLAKEFKHSLKVFLEGEFRFKPQWRENRLYCLWRCSQSLRALSRSFGPSAARHSELFIAELKTF